MITDTFLDRLSVTDRALVSQRWGLGTLVHPMMGELLRTPRVVHRTYRRLNELGLYTLLELLAEHVGHPIPAIEALESEARVLRRWLLLIEEDGTWALPSDLAVAMLKPQDRERFFAASLLSRLAPEDLRGVERELGVSTTGSPIRRIVRLAEHIGAGGALVKADDSSLAMTADLQSVDGKSVAAVRVVPGTGGGQFTVELDDGTSSVVAPRELALAAGHRFDEKLVEDAIRLQPDASPVEIHLPEWGAAGALLVFSTVMAAEEATRLPALAPLIQRALSDRALVTRPDCSRDRALDILESHGFAVETIRQNTVKVSHASR